MMTTKHRNSAIKERLLKEYAHLFQDELFLLPGIERGAEAHLRYLTLVYTISGGRAPKQLWEAAAETYAHDPELFDPNYLAYIKPKKIEGRLRQYGLSRRKKMEATVWQSIGQALVMRAQGNVTQLLVEYGYDAGHLMQLLKNHKATFPMLSGSQTGPRWIYALGTVGGQAISGMDQLRVPTSPAVRRVLGMLQISGKAVSAEMFEPLNWLGDWGCKRKSKRPLLPICPIAEHCPIASYCQFGGGKRN